MNEQELVAIYQNLSADPDVQAYSQMLRGQQKFNILAKIEDALRKKKAKEEQEVEQEEVEEGDEIPEEIPELAEPEEMEVETEEVEAEEIPEMMEPEPKPKKKKVVKRPVAKPKAQEDLDFEDDFP